MQKVRNSWASQTGTEELRFIRAESMLPIQKKDVPKRKAAQKKLDMKPPPPKPQTAKQFIAHKLAECVRRARDLDNAIQELRDKVLINNEKLPKVRGLLKSARKERDAMDRVRSRLITIIRELKEEKAEIEDDLSRAEIEIEDLSEQLTERDNWLARVSKERDEALKERDQIATEIARRNETIDDLVTNLTRAEEEKDRAVRAASTAYNLVEKISRKQNQNS